VENCLPLSLGQTVNLNTPWQLHNLFEILTSWVLCLVWWWHRCPDYISIILITPLPIWDKGAPFSHFGGVHSVWTPFQESHTFALVDRSRIYSTYKLNAILRILDLVVPFIHWRPFNTVKTIAHNLIITLFTPEIGTHWIKLIFTPIHHSWCPHLSTLVTLLRIKVIIKVHRYIYECVGTSVVTVNTGHPPHWCSPYRIFGRLWLPKKTFFSPFFFPFLREGL